jgi:hypothetical protein
MDPSGAAVSNASVTAKDADRGSAWKTQSNDEGAYSLPRLPIGRYELRVEANGFQSAVRPAFNLELNQTARINVTLTLGQVSQQVEVSGAAPVLERETTSVGGGWTPGLSPCRSKPAPNQLALLMPSRYQPGLFITGRRQRRAA